MTARSAKLYLRPSLLLLASLLTSGCGSCGDGDATASTNKNTGRSAASVQPAPVGGALKATMDGEPFIVRSALLRSFGGRSRALTLSSGSISCSELNAWRERGNEKTLNLVLAPTLESDKPDVTRITSATYEQTTRRGELGTAKLSSLAVDEPVNVSLSLKMVAPVRTPSGMVNRKFVVDGSIKARNCGERSSHPDVKIRDQSGLSWSVAGNPIHARGATVSYRPDGAVLRLSTEPHSCTTTLSGSDLVATFYIDGPPPQPRRLVLSGNMAGHDRNAKLTSSAFSARLDESSNGKGFASVSIQGGTSVDGLDIVIEGMADAMVCAPKKK